MTLFLTIAPLLIPILAAGVVLVGRRTDEDEKAALALGLISAIGAAIAFPRHDQFNGYEMAWATTFTAIALLGYVVYRRRQAY